MKTSVGTTEGGKVIALAPDVAYIPAPPPPAGPGGIPTPFPNMGSLSDAKKVTTKVLVKNKGALVEGAYIPSTSGDEPGCSQGPTPGIKGLKSRKNTAKVEFKQQSSTVKFEGKGVICLGAMAAHNEENTMGKFSVPSQTTVDCDM